MATTKSLEPSLRTAKREEVEATEEDEEVQTLRAELKQAQTVKERFKHKNLNTIKHNQTLYNQNQSIIKWNFNMLCLTEN